MTKHPFQTLMGSVNSALVVVTTSVENTQAGCLVGYHSQASIAPQHYCIWLSKANHTYRVGLRATHFAVHFLTADDLALAQQFGTHSGQHVNKFADLDVATDAQAMPLLADCPNHMVLERISLLDNGGDHVCVTGKVVSAHSNEKFTPLRVADIGKLAPAHGSDERIIEP